MIKSYIFASMYTVIGVAGWGAYSTISTEDTSVQAIQQVATSMISSQNTHPLANSIYRWRDHEGNWQYGEIQTTDVDMTKYDKELTLLRSLPRDALPTQSLTKAINDDGFLAAIPSLDGLLELVKMVGSSNAHRETQQGPETINAMHESEKLKQAMEQRNTILRNI